MPVLNEESTVSRALGNLERFEESAEVIAVDGGSTDRTLEILESAGVRIVRAGKGRGRQMNAGADVALGEILLFLHADTVLPKDALRSVEGAMAGKSVVGGRFKVSLDNPGVPYRVVGAMINLRDRLFGGFTGDQAMFVRRDVFRELGGFAEIELCEDLEMAGRLRKKGKVVRLPACAVTSARRWEKDGIVKTILVMWLIRALFYLRVSPGKLAKIYADTR